MLAHCGSDSPVPCVQEESIVSSSLDPMTVSSPVEQLSAPRPSLVERWEHYNNKKIVKHCVNVKCSEMDRAATYSRETQLQEDRNSR